MNTQLYPELTGEEIDAIILPLQGQFGDTSEKIPVFLEPRDMPLEIFGLGAEQYSFEAVGREIAAQFWHRNWDDGQDRFVQDSGRFRGLALDRLGASVVTTAIRPLADAMPFGTAHRSRLEYKEFCRELILDGFQSLFDLYPVLWNRLNRILLNQIAAYSETLLRLHNDRVTLVELGIDLNISVDSIVTAGDTHHDGRSVSIISFTDGTKLIYKPRSVDSEAGYSRLCKELNIKFGTDFLAARVVASESYGYVEFVAESTPASSSMRATGELLALMYVLNARDMHYSNILTTRLGPVPVDLETLLHPFRHKSSGTPESQHSGFRLLDRSVYGTGVLPLIITNPGKEGFLDAGYVGGGEQKGEAPFRQFRVQNPFSSKMKIIWAPDTDNSLGEDVSSSIGDVARIHKSCAEVIDGFTSAYQQFSSEKEWMFASIEKTFSGAVLRYIHNATIQYTHLLRMLTGSGASQSEELARGLVRRVGIASRNADLRLVLAECDQLWVGDVPYFSISANERTLHAGHGGSPVATIEASPLEDIRSKVDALSEKDMARETDLIRIAFYAKLPDPHDSMLAGQIRLAVPTVRRSRKSVHDGKLLDLGVKLGMKIKDEMVDDHYSHLPKTWLGPVASGDPRRPWPPGVLGYDLYTGRVGTALSLLALGRAVQDDILIDTATAVFEPISRILTTDSYELRSIARAGIGAYSGFAGTLWSLAAAGRIVGNNQWVSSAASGTELLSPPPLNDKFFDVLSGGIGSVLIAGAVGSDGQASVAEQCRFALESDVIGRMEYSGLAHGVAGVLLFAARSYKMMESTHAQDLALAAVKEIDTSFRGSEGTMRTNRTGVARSSDSWCNGSAGMLLAYHEAANAGLISRDEVSQIMTRMGSHISTSLTICHGVLGLYETTRVLSPENSEADRLAESLGSYLTAQHLEARTQDLSSRYNFSRSLMAGLPSLIWHIAHRLDPQLVRYSPASLAGGITE